MWLLGEIQEKSIKEVIIEGVLLLEKGCERLEGVNQAEERQKGKLAEGAPYQEWTH